MSPKLKDFDELMNSRFSCRAFLTKEVDQKTIAGETLIAKK